MGRVRANQENQEAKPEPAQTQWQHPFVDIFKLCKVERFPEGDFQHAGKVVPCIVSPSLNANQSRPAEEEHDK